MRFTKELLSLLNNFKKQIVDSDNLRENIIKKSRVILKDSKKAIFLLNDFQFKKSRELILSNFELIKKIYDSHDRAVLAHIGALSESIQEFSESYILYNVLCDIFKRDDYIEVDLLNIINFEDYLKGLCDVSGELVRISVKLSIKDRVDEIVEIEEIVKKIYYHLLQFTNYSGSLRNKIDSVKWNLSKIQEVIFKYKMR
ncbi:MAG: hypothetical protein PWR32_189 [Candidatus Woesearchaeota archaeon]|nr:hypothetical protein [Candidatus Woesearchaeota archaeon]